MVMIRANFADELAAGFRVIFFNNFGHPEYPPEYTELYNMEDMKVQYIDDSYTTGVGTIPKKTEGASVTFQDALQGFDERYTAETYNSAYRITEEMLEDGRYRTMRKLPEAFGFSMRVTREQDGANILNNGFDTANYADGGDGKALLTTDHPLMGGGSQKNELTNPANLNEASLNQMLIDIAATTNDMGLPMQLIPVKLVVHRALEMKAYKLVKSIKEPGTANNDPNFFQKFDLRVVVNHFLTSSNAWFVQCSKHQMNWFNRVMPSHERGNDFDTGDLKFKIRARWIRGWTLPWGIFGSPGV